MTLRPSSRIGIVLVLGIALGSGCAGRKVNEEKSETPPAPTAAVEETNKMSPEAAKGNPEASAEYHFSLAQAHAAQGSSDRAIEEYKLTLMFDPNSSLVHARLASEYVKKGMLAEALETCKAALKNDPSFIDARLMLAGLYSTTHETTSALAEYNRVLKQDPTHEEAMVYKSQLLIEENRPSEAAQDLQKFLKRNPDSALAWYYLGRSEQRLEHFKPAVAAYLKAREVRPGFSQASLALGFLYEENNRNDEAVRLYKEVFADSQDVAAANRLATIYLKEGRYKDAIPYLEGISAADPDDLNARVKLGLVHMETKDYTKAIATFEEILTKSPDAERIQLYLGILYKETKEYEKAKGYFAAIKPDSKLYVDGVLNYVEIMRTQNKIEEAKVYVEAAIVQQPKTPTFYILAASLEEEGKKLDQAVTILTKGVKLFSDDEKLRYYLGSLYDRMGETDKSLEQMEAILVINPDNADALNYIGYTWTVKGMRMTDAEKLLKKAMALKPTNGYIKDSWGWHLFVRGRLKEAVVELERAVQLKPDEPTILEHLGDAYMRANLREKALLQYQEAYKFMDDDDNKKKLASKIENVRTELVRAGRPVPQVAAPSPAASERAPASR